MKFIQSLFVALLLLAATAAQAVPVMVNPGAFGGRWNVDNINNQLFTGPQTVDVPAGRHFLNIAGKSVFFTLAADGTALSENPVAVNGGAGILTFNTVPVQINPGTYLGSYNVPNITWNTRTNTFREIQDAVLLNLVPGLTYSIQIAGKDLFTFTVAADGSVTSGNTTAAVGSQGALTFNNTTIQLDPGLYTGSFRILSVMYRVFNGTTYSSTQNFPNQTGPLSAVVLPGLSYYASVVGTGSARNSVAFDVDANGSVTSSNPAKMTASGNTLTFVTAPVIIDPQQYIGAWHLYHAIAESWPSGQRTIQLVVDMPYALYPNGNRNPNAVTGDYVELSLDINGIPSTNRPTTLTSSGNVVTFRNTTVNFNAGAYTGNWYLLASSAWQWSNGIGSLVLVPDWRYEIRVDGQTQPFNALFDIDAPGNVISLLPVAFSADGTNNTLTFNTVPIVLDTAGTVSGYMSFIKAFTYTGPTAFDVVPGLNYRLFTSGYSLDYLYSEGLPPFAVNADCSVSGFPFFLKGTGGATLGKTQDVSAWSWTCAAPANTAPVANAGAAQTVEQTSPAGALVTLNGAASSDADGNALTFVWSGPFGSATGVAPTVQFPTGSSNANLIVNDGTVDSALSSVMITVQDTTAPVVTAPAAVTAEATGAQTTVIIGTATATDAVGVVSISSDAPATFPLGTTTVIWMATDAAGNVGSAVQSVTVTDSTAPVLTAPAAVTMEATGPQTAVAIGTATATDIFAVSITSDAPATYAVGTTLVTWSATDANGNVSTATQTVTVTDLTAPVVTAPLAISVMAAGAAGTPATDPAIAALLAGATATDAVGVVGLITHNAPATFPVGVTTVTFSVADAAGNIGTAISTVTVTAPNPALLTAAQIAALTPAQMAMLTPVQVAQLGGQLSPAQIASLSKAQKRALKQSGDRDDVEEASDSDDDHDKKKERKKSKSDRKHNKD